MRSILAAAAAIVDMRYTCIRRLAKTIGAIFGGKMLDRPLHEIPMRTLERPQPRVDVRRAADGLVYLSCGLKFEPGLPSLIDYLQRAAEIRPETTFLAQRDAAGEWQRLSYAAAWRDTAAIATWLMRRGLG